jgi:glyoxylase-like metal-dependent hydrolase (beta-lactamase superfamily II)
MHNAFYRLPLVALLAVLPARLALAQEDVSIETVPVAAGVHMLIGQGGNIGVVAGEDGIFLIDDQFAPLTEKIKDAVATIDDGPIRFVFNTHWHGDHTGGNENLGGEGALIVAHENVRQRMSTEQFNAFFNSTQPPSPEAALPVVTFSEAVTFHLNGEEIHAFHVEPAHTDGDAVVHLRTSNAVHMGDLFFSTGYPYIDLSSGGSVNGLIDAAARVLAVTDGETKIIPGHGPLSDRAGLQNFRDMVVTIRDRVQEHINAGRSVDEVIAAGPTADFDEAWGKAFMNGEQFIRIVYESLSP